MKNFWRNKHHKDVAEDNPNRVTANLLNDIAFHHPTYGLFESNITFTIVFHLCHNESLWIPSKPAVQKQTAKAL